MTNQEQLERMIYYTNGKSNIFVFEHGTLVVGAIHEEAAKKILKHFDVDKDGEGSSFGDFEYLGMDDGNFLISFTGHEYYVSVVKSAEEMKTMPDVEPSATEVFGRGPLAPFDTRPENAEEFVRRALHGVAARKNRTKDARGLNVVARFIPQ